MPDFPWRGRIARATGVRRTGGSVIDLAEGDLVRVTGLGTGGYELSVKGDKAACSGLPPDSVDEAVCAELAKLAGNTKLTWGSNGAWRMPRWTALTGFELSNDQTYTAGQQVRLTEDAYQLARQPGATDYTLTVAGDGGTMTIPKEYVTLQDSPTPLSKGRQAYDGQLSKDYVISEKLSVRTGEEVLADRPREDGTCMVAKDAYSGRVPATALKMTPVSMPSHEDDIQLMCYELAPYAAVLAGLRTQRQFLDGLDRGGDSGSEHWASLWATMGDPIKISKAVSHRFQRGDLIVFWAVPDGAAHTAVATGERDKDSVPLVYSLWHTPDKYVVKCAINAIITESMTEFRVARPGWHAESLDADT
jgi:hypothetical protein